MPSRIVSPFQKSLSSSLKSAEQVRKVCVQEVVSMTMGYLPSSDHSRNLRMVPCKVAL